MCSSDLVDFDRLSAGEQEAFGQVDLGQGVLTQEDLLIHYKYPKLTEIPR